MKPHRCYGKLKRDKRGIAMMISIVIWIFILIGVFMLMYYINSNNLNKFEYIGQGEMEILKAASTAESMVRYLESASTLSLHQSVYELGQEGGMRDIPCGKVGSFVSWKNQTASCKPDQIEQNLNRIMRDNMDYYTSFLQYGIVPYSNYHFSFSGSLDAEGIPLEPLKVWLSGIVNDIPTKPDDAKQIVNNIWQTYGTLIAAAANNVDPKVPLDVMVGAIAAASGGKEQYVSSNGCAGLGAHCLNQAERYKDIFGSLTACGCEGIECQTRPLCTTDNDGRLSSERSITALAKELSQLLEKYEDTTNPSSFALGAYRGGTNIIDKALSGFVHFDGDYTDGIQWQMVAQRLSPGYIAEYEDIEKKREEVILIRLFVDKAKGYAGAWSDEQSTGKATKPKQKRVTGTYSLMPGIKTHMDYDLGIYDKLYENAQKAETLCDEDMVCWHRTLQEGLPENHKVLLQYGQKIHGKNGNVGQDVDVEDWYYYCEPEPERVLDVMEYLASECMASPDDDCVCTAQWKPVGQQYSVGVEENRDETIVRFTQPEWRTLESTALLQDVRWIPSSLTFKEDDVTLGFRDGLTGDTHTSELLRLYKSKGKLDFVKKIDETMELVNGITHEKKEECGPGKMVRVCVIDEGEEEYMYQPAIERTDLWKNTLRFSLYLAGTPPPMIGNLSAVDKIREEGSFLIEWEKIDIRDLTAYSVYVSKRDLSSFSGTEKLRAEASKENSGVERIVVPISSIEKQDGVIDLSRKGQLDECKKAPQDEKCYYTVYEYDEEKKEPTMTEHAMMHLAKGSVYEWDNGNITYVLGDLEDGEDYYITVTGIKKDGRESEDYITLGPLYSLDDLEPNVCWFEDPPLAEEMSFPVYQCHAKSDQDIDAVEITYLLTGADGSGYEKQVREMPREDLMITNEEDKVIIQIPVTPLDVVAPGTSGIRSVVLSTVQHADPGRELFLKDTAGQENRIIGDELENSRQELYNKLKKAIGIV